jgi:hypothetical protein
MTLRLADSTWFRSNHRRTSSSRIFPSLTHSSDEALIVGEWCKTVPSGDSNVSEPVALFIGIHRQDSSVSMEKKRRIRKIPSVGKRFCDVTVQSADGKRHIITVQAHSVYDAAVQFVGRVGAAFPGDQELPRIDKNTVFEVRPIYRVTQKQLMDWPTRKPRCTLDRGSFASGGDAWFPAMSSPCYLPSARCFYGSDKD